MTDVAILIVVKFEDPQAAICQVLDECIADSYQAPTSPGSVLIHPGNCWCWYLLHLLIIFMNAIQPKCEFFLGWKPLAFLVGGAFGLL